MHYNLYDELTLRGVTHDRTPCMMKQESCFLSQTLRGKIFCVANIVSLASLDFKMLQEGLVLMQKKKKT